jgi:succinate dehydrogenase / fumarate reductase membrane anchor subunit
MATFGSKRIVAGAGYGLRDWLVQRVSGALIVLFTIALLVQVLMPGEMDYIRWSGIFAQQWMKVITFTLIVALTWHAWIGVRDIWMDYVKPVGIRLTLHVFTIVWLVGCAGWATQVLWRL